MSKKKKIAIISSTLLTSGVIFLLLNVYIFGIFLLITGTVYLLLCAIVLFAQKHVVLCPSCGFEVLGARKKLIAKAMSFFQRNPPLRVGEIIFDDEILPSVG